jgi:hypothetical protein
MTISLVGEVADAGDVAGNFSTINSGANISGDDDAVENALAVGDKMSNTTEILASDTLTSTYDFSVGGTHEGWHMIGWVNTKTPINATTGIVGYFRNAAGHLGTWNAMPTRFYKGGFVTRVLNPSQDFDGATTWTVGGNPAQLDDVSIMGFQFTTTTSIMGSFNNVQIDQFTVGLGIRADVGTSGTPNNFEDIRAHDEDTNFFGWWAGVGSSLNAKGGAYIGPATGDVASWFTDTAKAILFEDEHVAAGFYGIFIRGGNTTVDLSLMSISAAKPTNSRWNYLVDAGTGSVTGGVTDTNSSYSGYDQIELNGNSTFIGTTLIDGILLTQNGATLTGLSLLNAATATGVHAILSDNPGLITVSEFTQGAAGHAVRCDTIGTYGWSGNSDSGYTGTRGDNLVSSSGSNDAMFYNNSGGLITLNVSGGGQAPSVRNGAGATTVVNNNTQVTFAGMKDESEVWVFTTGTSGEGNQIAHIEDAITGTTDDRSFSWSAAAAANVYYRILNKNFKHVTKKAFIVPSGDVTINIDQIPDLNNPRP